MADRIIDFDKATKDWEGARQHLHSVESILRMMKGFAASGLINNSEIQCDIELVCDSAIREAVLSDKHLDEIEQTLWACRDKLQNSNSASDD